MVTQWLKVGKLNTLAHKKPSCIDKIMYNIKSTSLVLEYSIHWNKRPWAVKFQRPFFGSQAPMGAYLGGRLFQ